MDFDWSNYDTGGDPGSGYVTPGASGGFTIPAGFGAGGNSGADAFGVGSGDNSNAGAFTDPSTWAGTGPGFGVSLANFLSSIGKGTGLLGKGGDPNWLSILGTLGPLLGGLYTKSQTGKANDQMQAAIAAANSQITGSLGGASSLYDPYRQAGQVGLQRLQDMPQSNLAARYKPLGTGAGFSLGNVAKGQ